MSDYIEHLGVHIEHWKGLCKQKEAEIERLKAIIQKCAKALESSKTHIIGDPCAFWDALNSAREASKDE